MSHSHRGLIEEFPEKRRALQTLRTKDTNFARLVEEYDVVNQTVHRAETNITPLDDFTQVTLRKYRANLKDEIWRYLID